MKKLLLVLLAGVFTACEFYTIEERVDPRDRVTGAFSVEEYSATYHSTTAYTVWISKSGYYSNDIMIDNFYGADIRLRAEVNGNRILIPWQEFDGYEVEGVGTIAGDLITFSYKVRDTYSHPIVTDFCDSEMWRDF